MIFHVYVVAVSFFEHARRRSRQAWLAAVKRCSACSTSAKSTKKAFTGTSPGAKITSKGATPSLYGRRCGLAQQI